MSAALAPAALPPIEPPHPLRAGQYLRVSLDKWGAGTRGYAASVNEQDGENAEHAERLGWTMTETYRDNSISASRYSRKERGDWERLLGDIAADQLDVLILWESSRGSRKVYEWAMLIELCEEHRVKIYVTSHGHLYDPAVPRDRRSMMEDAVDSEYESGKTSMRVKRSAAANAAAGKPHGKIPFGYERLYDERTKRLVEQREHPEQAPVVEKIFADLAAGKTLKAIACELNAGTVSTKTGVPWGWSQVREIALNLTYVAKRTHHGAITEGNWPRLIDDATFYTVRRILTDPARKTTKPGKVRHLVSMYARCAECGGPMTVTLRQGGGRKLASGERTSRPKGETYFCRAKSCLYINKESLETYIVELVLARLVESWDALTAAGDTEDAAILAARDEVARIDAELEDLYAGVKAKRVSTRALGTIEPDLIAQLEAARKRVEIASTPPALRPLLVGPKSELRQRWEAAPVPARREVVKALMRTLVVHRNPVPGHRVPAHQRVAYAWR